MLVYKGEKKPGDVRYNTPESCAQGTISSILQLAQAAPRTLHTPSASPHRTQISPSILISDKPHCVDGSINRKNCVAIW